MNGIPYSSREEWLQLRRQGIGGSDAAAILGVSRWSTAYDVWEDKVTAKPERPPTPRMMWGRRLEDVVAEAITDTYGIRVRRSNRILVHRELPFVIGSVDRLSRDAVVEIKMSRSGDHWATEEEAPDLEPVKRVPMDYYVQGQHYAAVTGKPRVLFGVLVGGNDLRLIETPADPGFIQDLMEVESEFWRTYVETETPPPLSWADAPRLSQLYPRGEGEKIATPEIDLIVEELLRVRARVKSEEEHRTELEVKVKEYLADASDLVSGVARVTWRNSVRRSVDWESVASAYRGLAEEIQTTVTSRGMHGTADKIRTVLEGTESLFTRETSVRTFRVADPK